MELVNEYSQTGKFRKVYSYFWTDSKYEKKLMATVALEVNSLQKAGMEYHGKLGQTLGRIYHIVIMIRIEKF